MEQVSALDEPRMRRADAIVVSTLAKLGKTTEAVTNLRKRDPQQKIESPMPQAQQTSKKKMTSGMMSSV